MMDSKAYNGQGWLFYEVLCQCLKLTEVINELQLYCYVPLLMDHVTGGLIPC